MAALTPMMQQYLSIKEEAKDAFLFFRLGDFYELFFDDAVLAAKELEITLTGRAGGGEDRIPMCGVPYHSAEGYIARLIEKGYKVAICEQVEDPSVAKGVVRREIVRVVTPGTVMESKSLSDKANNYIVSVAAEAGQLALAACDLSTGELYATSFDEASELLQDEINVYGPAEIVGDASVLERLRAQPPAAGRPALYTERLPMDEDKLRQLLPDGALDGLPPARLRAVSLLAGYLAETQKRSLGHLRRVQGYEPSQYLILDPFTRRNLELTETVQGRSRKGSLLWLLDRTKTSMGGRLLRRWIDKPLLSAAAVEERLDAVAALHADLIQREDIRAELDGIYDLERLVGRVAYGTAGGRDLAALKASLERVPSLLALLAGSGSETLRRLADGVDDCGDLREMIDTVLVDEPPVSTREGGLIRAGYDDYLDQLREASSGGKRWLADLERREREATGIRSLKIGYNKVFGYYLEVSKANLGSLPEGRYERKQTLANAERFVTPELKEKERLILEAEEKMTDLEYSLFLQLRDHIADQLHRLQRLADVIARADVLQSLAAVSAERRYVRPQMGEEYDLSIEGGRHPVVEAVLDGAPFMANGAELSEDGARVLLITGPNMAGKSTYMRQTALICIMAQIGCFVPARSARLPLVDRIFTRIGAADDLAGGQSTFMVEMRDIQQMTDKATRRSLVIIDELGRGTSTAEGMSIAQAVIEFLHDRTGCKALVSTHFHELSHLEQSLRCLRNASMAVKESGGDVTFLRRLVPGAASTSYGIYCARLAGLPESIIGRAYELLAGHEAPAAASARAGEHGRGEGLAAREAAAAYEEAIEPQARPDERPTGAAEPIASDRPAAPQTAVQLSIFGEPETLAAGGGKRRAGRGADAADELAERLRKLDLFNLTPMQAMQWLNEEKVRLG
ncbi:DNA mismatch repair protein MutS [Paenibacillus pasadenensis]|uniref:DNA mismatch repair protein MutS n=1 Tax=Paenibacillus pasadenensis TaxID=217090 RepID=A0A2N5N656_9BACL|nr:MULTISPECIES: DNA mismatch repair protein MutS [Paenibacillus]PLT45802.1 DNA mismatch repair protein MutS [Paenibacillus pasadenensis]QGG56238.1 DNA mismatch repair protein MutS [Paenibacillus sp. B01]